MIDIGKQKVNVKCPSCGRTATVTLSQVSKQEVLRCGCGRHIQLVDSGGSNAKAVRDMNNSIRNFERTLKKLGK